MGEIKLGVKHGWVVSVTNIGDRSCKGIDITLV
jgi:hypothetical protein